MCVSFSLIYSIFKVKIFKAKLVVKRDVNSTTSNAITMITTNTTTTTTVYNDVVNSSYTNKPAEWLTPFNFQFNNNNSSISKQMSSMYVLKEDDESTNEEIFFTNNEVLDVASDYPTPELFENALNLSLDEVGKKLLKLLTQKLNKLKARKGGGGNTQQLNLSINDTTSSNSTTRWEYNSSKINDCNYNETKLIASYTEHDYIVCMNLTGLFNKLNCIDKKLVEKLSEKFKTFYKIKMKSNQFLISQLNCTDWKMNKDDLQGNFYLSKLNQHIKTLNSVDPSMNYSLCRFNVNKAFNNTTKVLWKVHFMSKFKNCPKEDNLSVSLNESIMFNASMRIQSFEKSMFN